MRFVTTTEPSLRDDLSPEPKPLPAVLNFEGHNFTILDLDGEPWFVASEIAYEFGYRQAHDLTRTLEEDEKGTVSLRTLGGEQSVTTLSEGGLYRAIIQRKANKIQDPERAARIGRFQRWVFHDVLPSIRKTGSYALGQPRRARVASREVRQTFGDYRAIAKLIGLDANQASLAAAKATRKLTGTNPLEILEHLHLQAEKQEPMLTASDIGLKFESIHGKQVNQLLAAHGYQASERDFRNRLSWLPTQKGASFGLWLDTNKRQNDGTPVKQWKWHASVVGALRADIMAGRPPNDGDTQQ